MAAHLQVRFGVLNAGNFGVSQSRKRTFIWGVAPGNILPDWPKPQHVFRSSQLTINLPGNVQVSLLPYWRICNPACVLTHCTTGQQYWVFPLACC